MNWQLKEIKSDTRAYNVGDSDYSKHKNGGRMKCENLEN